MMLRRSIKTFAATAAALLALALPAAAAPPLVRTIWNPTVITHPGSYVLARNIVTAGGGPAIEIQANEVSLDLGGHRLVGPPGRIGMGVLVSGATDVRIHDGSIARFGIGVFLNGAKNAVVENLQIDGVDSGGAPPDVEIGIMLVDTRGARIADNVITDTFLGIFVRGDGSGGNRVEGNLLTAGDQGELGICYNPAPDQASGGPHGDLVTGNVVSRFRRGLSLSADSSGNVIRGNTLAYIDLAIQEATPGANLVTDNDVQQISR
jgi:nitrous oxidase accessory protein NosD